FKLGADIDLNIFPYNSGTGWQPIGSGDTYFTGSFDGAGYTISNLLINRPEGNYTGLFGSTGINAKLLNVKLENATVNGGRLSGCLVGYNEGSLGNCNASGDISGSSYTGGLIGSNWGNITTCCSTGNVSGSAYNTGGLAGYNYGSISNSYASGSVSSDSYNTGGLAGYNYGSISNSYASGSVSSNSYDTGGLVGENDGSISNSYASGSVSGDSDTGGLVGYNGKSISNCYYDKEKSGQRDTGKGIPKTTLEMQNQSTYVGWDFVSIWSITAGAYPVILTQAGEQLPVISAYSFLGVSGQVAIDQNNRYITVELPRGTSTENLVAVFTLSDGASASVNDIAQISGVTANDFRYPLNYKVVDANGKAAAWNVTVSILAEGTGSADDPYIIKTAGELDCVRNHLESCFKLGADIDLGLGYYGRGSGWLPVGSTDTPFNGVFDGGGYIIRNLFIYRPQDNYTGLFGCLGSKAIIKNVNLEDVMVYGGDYTGALAGDNHGIINTSCVTGSVHGDYWTGGLAGANSRGSISNCYSNAGVIGMQNVGGLAGINRGSIMYCYNSGHVSGEYDGGLVGSDGWSSNNGTIRNSYYDEETAGVCVSVSSQARTTAQMKQEATYLGWDFDSIWSIAANQYPRLKNVSGNDTGFNDYIIINTADELNAVRENLNGYYRLGADIDLGAAPYNTDGGWLPIGDNEHPFTGVLDGTGYSIANLCIDRPDGQYSGLFGVVSSSASLANIKLINVSIDAGEYTGGLAGNNRGLISNSGIGGTIKGSNDYTGGLVAVNDGIINNSFNNAVITGFYYCGGLAGENHGSINNSFSNASIDGSYYCGGLAGRNYGSIDYCYSTGLVSGVSSYAGGLVGTNNEVINYSYYDKETSGRNDTGKGEAKTTVEMKQQSTYVGWDFNTIWLIDEGNAYPVFGSFSNAAPQAQAIWIKGIAAPGQVLNGIYSYYDAEGDREGNSSFQWYRETPGDDSRRAAIAGATGRTYTLGDDDAGQNIYFEVIPAAVDGTINGNAVSTDIYIPKLPIQVDQILWLQGDAGTTISEANQLTGWQDQSLCGNDAFDTGSDAWPQVVGNGLNGHAVIRFDGWQNRIVLPALAESLPQATTIMVLKNDSCDDRALLSPFNMSNDTDGSICFMRQGMMYVGGKSDYNLAVPTSSFNDGFNILIITADASEHKNMQVYLNETLQTTLFYDAGIYENEWSIAGSNSSDYDHCFKGDIAEVMVYKGIISEARITDIVAYLKNKYALNLDQLP
ncbi:MAG: hypothetical protein GXY49_07070, partial [Syntrophomonadaceae bacterium]|nr:hypothetical protein [Syntrophomonadaceae bacterium]